MATLELILVQVLHNHSTTSSVNYQAVYLLLRRHLQVCAFGHKLILLNVKFLRDLSTASITKFELNLASETLRFITQLRHTDSKLLLSDYVLKIMLSAGYFLDLKAALAV